MSKLPLKYVIFFPIIVVLFTLGSCAEKEKDRLSTIKATEQLTVITRNNAHSYYTYRGKAMGFEYDLAGVFANYLGVDLKVKTTRWRDMINALNKERGDFIAASMTITPSRKKMVDFSNEYLSIQQRVVVHKDNYTIKSLADLNGKIIHVRGDTSYEQRLSELQKEGVDLAIKCHDDIPTEELIRQVAEKKIEVTVADSNIAFLNRRYYPNIKISIPIEEPQSLGWAVKKGEKALLSAINDFFNSIKTDRTFEDIYNSYYGNVEVFDRFDLQKFHQSLKTTLPKYKSIIEKVARKYGFDWRLIAAIIYQESHFDPQASSHRGVRGLMQLTKRTAEEMGVTDRLDPEQSIMGGVKYLKKLHHRYEKAQGFDRMLITLASYNVGPGHVADAQRIAREKGLNPYKWSSLEQTLPLLCYARYIKMSKHGYCRGTEPVRYVNRILTYFDILRRQSIGFLAGFKSIR